MITEKCYQIEQQKEKNYSTRKTNRDITSRFDIIQSVYVKKLVVI